jgi:hypothetical protein
LFLVSKEEKGFISRQLKAASERAAGKGRNAFVHKVHIFVVQSVAVILM